MERDKQYEVFGPDGIPLGYFLDNRLYEYRTSTCVGFLNDKGELIDEKEFLGHLENDVLIRRDGTRFTIQMKNE